MNSSIDDDLSQALNNIHEATDMDMSVIAEEEGATAARVRSAQAQESEHAMQTGDDAVSLLSDIFSTDDVEGEVNERIKRRKENEAKRKAENDAKAEKARREAEQRIREEMERVEKMKARKEEMKAQLEKERRIAEVGYDEEEVARQKAEEERRQREEEEAEAREIEENERMIKELKRNQEELDRKNKEREAKRLEEERAARRKRNAIISIVAAVVLTIGGAIGTYYYFKKAPDFYTLSANYPNATMSLTEIPSAGMMQNALALNTVEQAAPKVAGDKKHGGNKPKNPNNPFGKLTDLSGNTITK